jgi:hypothetical protein
VPSVVKKLPARTLRFAVPLGTSLVMTFLVSGIATLRAIGFDDELMAKWMSSWMIAWAIAFPTMLVMMPLVRRLLLRVIESD